MFDYINHKRDPIVIIFYSGSIPFVLAWALHQSLITAFMLQAYLTTCLLFVFNPFESQRQEVKQRWFWNVMLGASAPVHVAFLVGMWFLDARYATLVTGTGTIFFNTAIVYLAETAIHNKIVDRHRPHGADGASLP